MHYEYLGLWFKNTQHFSPCSCFALKMPTKRQTQSKLKLTGSQKKKSANCHLWIKEDYNMYLAWRAHKSHFTKYCKFVQKMIQWLIWVIIAVFHVLSSYCKVYTACLQLFFLSMWKYATQNNKSFKR